jgi:hypothetical protein
MTDNIRNGTSGGLPSDETHGGRSSLEGQRNPMSTGRRGSPRVRPLDPLSDTGERDLLVKRYLLGYLSEDEVEAFEKRFVHDQALLDELDEAERFIDGMKGLGREGRLQQLAEPAAFRRIARTGASSWYVRGACAGAVVIAAIAVFLYVQLRDVQAQLAHATAPQVNMQIVDLEVTRAASVSGEPARSVELPAEPGWILLALDTGPAAGERRARLLDSGEHVVAESTGLQPDDLGVVYWAIHSSMLREGDYVAQVGVASASEPDVRYVFRVMARG